MQMHSVSKLVSKLSIIKSMGGHPPTLLRLLSIAVVIGAFATATTANAQPGFGEDGEHWVGTWGTALHAPDLGVPGLANTGFSNQTLRQIVHASVGGHKVRVRFSAFGANAVVIGAAHIALHAGGAVIMPGSDRTLTFGGKPSITIPAGALVLSDPVNLEVPALSDLAVSIFVPGNTGPATWHFEARQTLYVSQPGDFTGSYALPVDSTSPAPQAWFWLAGVDVATLRKNAGIVTFGDSITDGTQSTPDANARWPDDLARRLMDHHSGTKIGVMNKGLAGNRMLRDSLGPNALARFDRDTLASTGVTHVIVQLGGNDIFTINPGEDVTVEQVIQAHKQLIARAHAKGLRIYGCTLTPVQGFLVPGTPFPVFTTANEAKRQAVNAWIRSSGEYDAVIDFDRVLRDPDAPARILPRYDSGDHGHPTDAGYRALADSIDLRLFSYDD
jgi:lysophospholipase L1-like esterase